MSTLAARLQAATVDELRELIPLVVAELERNGKDAELWRKWMPYLDKLNRKPFNLAIDIRNAKGEPK